MIIELKAANDNFINRKAVVRLRHLPEPFPEKHLWKLVICQAIEDATTISNKRGSGYRRKTAIKWLTECSEDFISVCELAGYSYEVVKRNVIKIIANENIEIE